MNSAPDQKVTFQNLVEKLVKDGAAILKEMNAKDADLLHMGVGVCGEAGELIDAIKKAVIYRKPLDIENMIEEMGDLEFYMERIRQITGITREQTLDYCTAKLMKRYEKMSYSDEAAQARNDKAPNSVESTGFKNTEALQQALGNEDKKQTEVFIATEFLKQIYEFTRYAAAPYAGKPITGVYPTTAEWWEKYFEDLEGIQRKIKLLLPAG